MKKFAAILFLLVTLMNCSEAEQEESKRHDLLKTVTSVVIFGNPETGDIFNTNYRTQISEKDEFENCFFYSLDSVVWSSSKREYADKDFESGHQSFCTTKSNDTLYINFKANPPANKHDQLKCCLIDSIDIPLKTKLHKIYCYTQLNEDPRWDETLYLSNEIGFIYSHYPFFKKKYELISHSAIELSELSIIKDSLKKRSGELRENNADSLKSTHNNNYTPLLKSRFE